MLAAHGWLLNKHVQTVHVWCFMQSVQSYLPQEIAVVHTANTALYEEVTYICMQTADNAGVRIHRFLLAVSKVRWGLEVF